MPISVASPRNGSRLLAPLRAVVREALALLGARAGEITIVLTDDAQLRELNRRYRGIDRATDVLSFSYESGVEAGGRRARGSGPPRVSGDLVISLDRLRAQARRYRVSEGKELARLVVHGALHLAGLDHHRAAERAHMRQQERLAMRAARSLLDSLDRAVTGAR